MSEHYKFKFIPRFALTEPFGAYAGLFASRWFAAYQWFVQRLYEWNPESTPYEIINGTSSINNREPYPIAKTRYYISDEVWRRLGMLLAHTGEDSYPGEFLNFCGLKKWADLDKPMVIRMRHSDEFPNHKWFELEGREFKASPNSCHEKATWIQEGSVQINYKGDLWRVRLTYGYKHDSSSWYFNISQNKKERLTDFAARVNAEIENLLLPDSNSRLRLQDERDWQSSHKAAEGMFYDPNLRFCGWEEDFADRLTGIKGSSNSANKIRLTEPRIRTIKNWIKSDANKSL